MSRGFVVALLGAESTGKSSLAAALVETLRAEGVQAVAVGEFLRQFCDREGRTPRSDEQRGIAAEQSRRIEAARGDADVVVADTTALMVAVYSDLLFGDESLYAAAEAAQRSYALTLLTALDLPWQADGLQRDGPHVRAPVDAALRASLARAHVDFDLVDGTGGDRLASAMQALRRARTCRDDTANVSR